MLQILLTFNRNVLKVFQSDRDEITIGRNGKNDICIDNLAVSNFHAKIKQVQDKYFIEDLDSTNGTYVNEEKITRIELQDGDIAVIGKHSLTFLLDSGENEGMKLRDSEMVRTMTLETEKKRQMGESPEPYFPDAPARLTVLEGETGKKNYQLTSRITEIGKEEKSQVKLKGMFAPKNLAYISRSPEGYILIPGDNAEKLRLNGGRIDKGTPLKNNDVIEAGKVKLQFHQS